MTMGNQFERLEHAVEMRVPSHSGVEPTVRNRSILSRRCALAVVSRCTHWSVAAGCESKGCAQITNKWLRSAVL
jgi:hypothetical protein